ncbi:alpha-L-rhamnosidase C-terminal domain-containing protein [Metabacillus litoralis]|uniref:alpha-L-rhamnosidase-related protein n=1 Tax=Metabacillus litoralis TaxID=152268 RepID=UPI002040FC5E|nr:alpha-L-rhamnosidase C-terminal domain-containing protein [Metabacillus litoralis]MCM3160796.1 alpha-L-rhamnosidase N-terminal domain-containing protein [Metabacillus litoralis]
MDIKIPLSSWIWIPTWSSEDNETPQIVYFRKILELDQIPAQFFVKLSADSRYKFYVNDKLIEVGPSKGDNQVWYYDEIDISSSLKKGKNVLAAIVLRYPLEHSKGNHGIWRTETPGFYFNGSYVDHGGKERTIIADNTWRTMKETEFQIVSESPYFAPLQILEKMRGNLKCFGWKSHVYNDADWEQARAYTTFEINRAVSPGNLLKRNIPSMNQLERQFEGISCVRQSDKKKEEWNDMLQGKHRIHIPPHSIEIIEIDAGELTTGYLRLAMSGGSGTSIKILTSESYAYPSENPNPYVNFPKKGDRTDSIEGMLYGFTDEYMVGGFGSNEEPEVYEPFWFRTFRFVKLEISTGNEEFTIDQYDYRETGYPLEIKTSVSTSDMSLDKVWDISVRTLKRCMHETYEDCPFYEQLQYAMDSRSQILYTYMLSADDRLARKCMDDFRRSQRYDGLLNASYPSTGPNVIPGFSIYYIMMLFDHMMFFDDKELIKYHFTAVDRILHYFDTHLNEQGLVGKIGGLNMQDRFWSFIDWTTEWDTTTGVPKAILNGPITMESFLYVMGLQHAAKLAEYLGRVETGNEYLLRAAKVQEAINAFCRGKNGLYQDGPGVEDYSQHCQVFAILTETVNKEEGALLLNEVLDSNAYTQCSVAMAFYLFRAVEKVGLYDRTKDLWNTWRTMVENNLTTCVEDTVNARSDCHAWGSLILYEIPAVVLGVKPVEPGFSKVEISPSVGYFEWAEGEIITPKGKIKISWKKNSYGVINLNYEAPIGISVISKK